MSSEAPEPMVRPYRASRPELFMDVARLYGKRSSCPRAAVGVVAVRDGRIVATGYVGAPSGLAHCDEVGCELVNGHCIRSVHAEANMVAWAARKGLPLEGCAVYSTHLPCLACSKLLANAGIEEVVWSEEYKPSGKPLLERLGIAVRRHTP